MSIPLAFIFDMDGVIIDSTRMHVEAWEAYLRGYGLGFPDLADRMLGKHNDELVRDLFASHTLTAAEIFEHGARKEALYREMIAPVFDSKLVAGAADFIRRHRGFPMAVATNAEPANVEFVLRMAGLSDAFPVIVSGHDVDRPKPFPDIYLRAAKLLGVVPDDCVVFEDSRTGVEAACAAGMRVVGLLTTLNQFDNVELAIRNFADPELEKWLSALQSSASSRS